MKVPALVRRAARGALRFRRSGGGDPLQVGALPYRWRQDGTLELLLITTRSSGRWIVPKGWPMAGKSHAEAAAQEAWEEAGVRGRIGADEIGRFAHEKMIFLAGAVAVEIAIFPLAVEEERDRWPEQGERRRRWFSSADAAAAVGTSGLATIIAQAATSLPRC